MAGRYALAAGLVLLSVRPAFPHAELLRSAPAAGAVLTAAPSRVQIWFSEAVEAPSTTAVSVYGPDGSRADQQTSAVAADDATEMSTAVTAAAQGTYTVRWRAISADGHPINGTFQFSLGVQTAAAAPVESAPSSNALGFQAAGRWLHLMALSLVIGPLALMLLAAGSDRMLGLAPRLWRLARVGALALLPAAAVMLAAQSSAVAGTVGEGLRVESLRNLLGTAWGSLWIARTAIAVVLAALVAWAAGRAESPAPTMAGVALAIASALIIATSLNGHPGATNPVWLSVGVDWLHTAATATWVGGLFALAFVALPALGAASAEARTAALVRIVPRFSQVAAACVQVLVVTGLYHTWSHVDGPSALTTTNYGQTLLIKLGLVGVTMLFAAVNLFVLKPRIAAALSALTPEGSARSTFVLFRRMVGAEVALAVVILAAVGVLTALPPASAAAAPAVAVAAAPAVEAPPALTLIDHAGATVVTLSLASADVGSNRTTVVVDGDAAQPAPQVRLRIEPPASSGIPPSTITPDGSGRTFHATLPLAPAGSWGINVLVQSGTATETATFRVELPLRGAAALLAAADERMNELRSAVETREVVAEGKQSKEQVEYQAPDRRRKEGEILEITAGNQHYMRHGTLWHTQTVEAYAWPSFRYAQNARDVTVLGRETLDGTECFVVSFVAAADGSRHRLWIATGTMRVLQEVTAAPGRFEVSRFSRFDSAVRISPPSS